MCPSGLNATLDTVLVWPVRGWPSGAGWAGSVRFHNRTVASSLPEVVRADRREGVISPLGLGATARSNTRARQLELRSTPPRRSVNTSASRPRQF